MNAIAAITAWLPFYIGMLGSRTNPGSAAGARPTKELSQSVQLAREAAQARELAWRHSKSDPGFAADLLAAADRHELESSDEVTS